MKKVVMSTGLFLCSLLVVGCTAPLEKTSEEVQSTETEVKKTTVSVTITLAEEGKEFQAKTVEVPEGTTLESILVDQFSAKADNGMVTSIDGREQQPAENKYWLFDINGQSSNVGANNYVVKNSDKIEWKLAKLD